MQTEVLEVVPGVDNHGQAGAEAPLEPTRELGAANASAKRNNLRTAAHRNRSLAKSRINADAGRAGAFKSSPRTSTAGTPSAASPITSEAPAATSSASAISVIRSLRPNISGEPTMSTSDGTPAAPSAMPVTPLRQGRPKL